MGSPDRGGRRSDSLVFRSWDEDSQSESGVCSPPLWGSNHRPRNRSLSPTSRIQAITRGQQELMEMVRNMPESCYELSLKDLVERQEEPAIDDSSRETFFRSKKRTENRALVTRSKSVDSGGFYLKMFFPRSFGPMTTRKKRSSKNDGGLNASSKVSPKPTVGDGSAKGVDRDWWRRRSSVGGESESGGENINSGSVKSTGSSSSSSGSYRSNSRHAQGGCWFCISPITSENTA